MTAPLDLEMLKTLVAGASAGPWVAKHDRRRIWTQWRVEDADGRAHVADIPQPTRDPHPIFEANAAFIAAFNPLVAGQLLTEIARLTDERDDARIAVLAELRAAPADDEIRKLLGMAQIAGGHPQDDDPEGFDAQVGREFIRLRHKFAAAGQLIGEVERLTSERSEVQAKTYRPGVLRCAKCNFRLVSNWLNASDGTISARETAENCPNDGAPMWRVSWEDECRESDKCWEQQVERAVAAEAEAERLRAALTAYQAIHKSVAADLLSCHQTRGNGTTQWMTEDDRDLRIDFRAADALARSALSQQGAPSVSSDGSEGE